MPVELIQGNIFRTKCRTIVNTVNCVGIMGAGIALEFKLRFPDMYERYKSLCEDHLMDIGKLWIYRTKNQWILNFPTKKDWKHPSKMEYLHLGLKKFVDTYQQKEIRSIAFPVLGGQHGGIDQNKSIRTMENYLSKLEIPVEIYIFDPMAEDDGIEKFRRLINKQGIDFQNTIPRLRLRTAIRYEIVQKVTTGQIIRLIQLLKIPGVGNTNVSKIFNFVYSS